MSRAQLGAMKEVARQNGQGARMRLAGQKDRGEL